MEPTSIATAISTALQGLVTDTISAIAAVAPYGITVFGATFAWKKGTQFFRSMAK